MPFSELDALLRRRTEADQFAGVALIRRGGTTLFSGAYGPASRRWQVPITMDTRFDNASMTKLFTAVAALQLVDQGRLGLDAPIHDFADLADTRIPATVTIHQLLTHTSGIADDADEEAGEDYEALWETTACNSVTRTIDFLPGFVNRPPNFAPGQGCRYCNAGYVLVGLAIEKVTGSAYRDHIRQTVFPAAGMNSSDFYDRREPAPEVAEGWDPVEDDQGNRISWRQNIYSYPPIGSPDAGAHVTAADSVSFLQALRAGRLLSPETTARFLTPQVHHHTKEDVATWFGFGLQFSLRPDGTIDNYYKEGVNAGVSGMVRHYPEEDLDVVVLANSAGGAWTPLKEIHRMVKDL